jgi:RNA polymerase sigma-70 factor (sigma-E family)
MQAKLDTVAVQEGRLARLYRQHVDDAFRLAFLLTGDRALAEDLAQEAFVRIMGRMAHLRHSGDFAAYLRKTVVNLANSHFRRRKVERRYVAAQARLPEPTGKAPDLGLRDELRMALMALPARQREAIVLRFYEDLSESQTAELMGCMRGTVRSLVSRGMETLRRVTGGGHDG